MECEIERKAVIRYWYNYLTPFVPRHQRERRAHLKQRHHNQDTTRGKPRGQSVFSRILAKRISKIKISPRVYMQRHTMIEIVNHSRSTALGRSVKILLGGGCGGEGGGGGSGGGLNRFYVATTLALSSAVVYTRYLFSSREEFLTHQCNISENIKIQRIQRWYNDEDSTANNNWNAEAKEKSTAELRWARQEPEH